LEDVGKIFEKIPGFSCYFWDSGVSLYMYIIREKTRMKGAIK